MYVTRARSLNNSRHRSYDAFVDTDNAKKIDSGVSNTDKAKSPQREKKPPVYFPLLLEFSQMPAFLYVQM